VFLVVFSCLKLFIAIIKMESYYMSRSHDQLIKDIMESHQRSDKLRANATHWAKLCSYYEFKLNRITKRLENLTNVATNTDDKPLADDPDFGDF
jgi:hypothetical protein